ncbi:MAG TPA: DUF2341 domain-containing protein [Verrucomicrobiae bacterium]|nr:DUF2341 domain-containing protein [Verrucomicrobiae bacterium]
MIYATRNAQGSLSRRIRGFLQLCAAALAVLAPIARSSATNLSLPQVDSYDVRLGTETFAPMYGPFTTNNVFVETAEAMTNMGSDIIKLYLGSNTSGQEGIPLPPNVTNLLTLVRDEPSYHKVFDMPFRHVIAWAYPLENSDAWWKSGYNATQGAKDYQEMYALTQYLLTNYNNSGKTFYLGHWEGDGYLEVNGWTTNPPAITIQGMIGWLNNRQKAVDDAKAATTYSNVWVYNYAECNRVRDAMDNGTNNNERVINCVVPYVTNLDYLSYSSYDAQNLSSSDLDATLNYMESMLPTNKATVNPGCRMWIGEYGWGYEPTSQQEPQIRSYMQRLINWNYNGDCLPYILMWEMYSNTNANYATNFCLINYADQKVPAWYLHNYFINDAKMAVAQFYQTNGRLPTDTEFTSLMSPLLNAPLSAPVPITVANTGSTLITNTAASVSGTVAQGIYGESEATVWVYYGTQDGGATYGTWQHAQYAGISTNFSPATFTTTLSGLLPNTNYYYRFYAQTFTTNSWAPASSTFSTVTINPTDYGSRTKVFFSGYIKGETLTDFPVLVDLSTNVTGFSYRQFASPAGGDLRFADESGILPLPYEIDKWNTNGISSVWVNVPSISTTNDFVWAYWGNPLATNPPAYTTNGAAWPNFDLVWHLEQSGFPYADSTLNYPALDGSAPAQTPGIIGEGQEFNGASTFLDAGVANLNNAFTLSAWVNIPYGAYSCQTIWANQPGGFGSAGFSLFVNKYNTTNGAVLLDTGDGSNGSEISTTTNLVTTGHWHLVTASVNRSTATAAFYVDGSPEPIANGGPGLVSDFVNNAGLNFGRFTNNALYFNGAMDEARIYGGIEDSNWVWASWATVASNSVLQSYLSVTRQTPALSVSAAGGNTIFAWPASGVGYTLYTATNLAPPVSWSPSASQPVWTNNQWQISLPSSSVGILFYRLQSQ